MSAKRLTGWKIWDAAPVRRNPADAARRWSRIRGRGMLRFDDLTLRTKSGSEVHAEVIANAYMEGDQRAIQFPVRDVTERKKFTCDCRK